MKTMTVSDLMVPLEEYATVSEEGTLYDAVMALEKAQAEFIKSRYPHRAVLVKDKDDRIVGKISQMDILRALEPQYDQMIEKGGSLTRFGFSWQFQKDLMKQFNLWDQPMHDICKKAGRKKVKEFMYTPTEGEYVKKEATLNEAVHQLVMGHHQSLLVTDKKEIVGVLRLTDVFMAIFGVISETCKS